jgi:hypothetical protein
MSSDQPNLPTPAAQPLATQTPAARPVTVAPTGSSSALRARLAPAALIVLALILWAIFMPRQSASERLATRVTTAIVNNDMKPVADDFNAIPREQLSNRAKVGLLSQDLNELGKFKAVKEDTPAGSPALYHHFKAQFEKGTWEEDLTYDSAGKIRSFHVHAPAANLTR